MIGFMVRVTVGLRKLIKQMYTKTSSQIVNNRQCRYVWTDTNSQMFMMLDVKLWKIGDWEKHRRGVVNYQFYLFAYRYALYLNTCYTTWQRYNFTLSTRTSFTRTREKTGGLECQVWYQAAVSKLHFRYAHAEYTRIASMVKGHAH